MTDATPKSEIKSELTWLPKKTFELKITIPASQVQITFDAVLDDAVKEVTLKGFRKGKAPRKMVEESVTKAKLYESVVEKLVSQAYQEAVETHHLHPILSPKITPVQMEEGQDWMVTAQSSEAPEVKLGDYQDAVKGLKAKNTIWTPDKAGQEDAQKNSEVSVEAILGTLLQNAEIELPDRMVEEEANRLLSNLIDQVNSVGMSVQQYLDAKHKTQESLQAEYRNAAEETLKLEFILPAIATDAKIEVSDADLDQLIAKTSDLKTKEAMQQPMQKLYLKSMLRKQKAVEWLKNL